MDQNKLVQEKILEFYEQVNKIYQRVLGNDLEVVLNPLRKTLELLLRIPLLFWGADPGGLEKDVLTINRLHERLKPKIDDDKINAYIDDIRQYTNSDSHYRDSRFDGGAEELAVSAATVLLNLAKLIVVFFWIMKQILGLARLDPEELRGVFLARPTSSDLEANKEVFGTRLAEPPSSAGIASFDGNEVALHHSALAYMHEIEEWARVFMIIGYFRLKYDADIPYVDRVRSRAEDIELVNVNVCDLVTVIAARLEKVSVIVYIGKPLSNELWRKTYSVVSNRADYIELIRRRESVNSDTLSKTDVVTGVLSELRVFERFRDVILSGADEALATETREAAFGTLEPAAWEKYQAICVASKGFRQSNVVPISDDANLARALRYPMDKWRLFLHPLQEKIKKNADPMFFVRGDRFTKKKKVYFIKGGPGTGKTIVLIHRAQFLLEKRFAELAPEERPSARILFLTFSRQLSRNIGELIQRFDERLARAILLKDIFSLVDGVKKGLLSFDFTSNARFPTVVMRDTGEIERYVLTDLLIDEFQDFPAKAPFIGGLLDGFYERLSSITCTYDEHQQIYTDEADFGDWAGRFAVEQETLTYCYRMAKELSVMAIEHRRTMLEYAKDVIVQKRPGAGGGVEFKVGEPTYAFGGGIVRLVRSSMEGERGAAEALAERLRKDYRREDIAILYFQDPGADPAFLEYLKGLEERHGIRTYQTTAVKGLEFKAGILLDGRICFKRYTKYLNDGLKMRKARDLCDAVREFCALEGKVVTGRGGERVPIAINLLRLMKFTLRGLESGDVALDRTEPFENAIVEYLLVDGFRSEKEIRNAVTLFGALAREGQARGMGVALYPYFLEIKRKIEVFERIKREVETGKRPAGPDEKRFGAEFADVVKNSYNSFIDFMKQTDQVAAIMIKALFEGKIEDSLLDINKFYVAITRFREIIYIVDSDPGFDLRVVLPGVPSIQFKNGVLGGD